MKQAFSTQEGKGQVRTEAWQGPKPQKALLQLWQVRSAKKGTSHTHRPHLSNQAVERSQRTSQPPDQLSPRAYPQRAATHAPEVPGVQPALPSGGVSLPAARACRVRGG